MAAGRDCHIGLPKEKQHTSMKFTLEEQQCGCECHENDSVEAVYKCYSSVLLECIFNGIVFVHFLETPVVEDGEGGAETVKF